MIKIVSALAGLVLVVPATAGTRPPKPTQGAKPLPTVTPQAETDITLSMAAGRMADWIASSKDNRALPYAIVDKNAASLFLFDAKARSLGAVPVLIGIAVGDDATPGVGSKKLGEIGPSEKTTPAGRFLAKFGLAAGKQRVLWVDYANSVALHTIPADASKKERRRERILSPASDDNRITFGCINVPSAFYNRVLRPLFQGKGGYVYVMPDTKPLEAVFPRLRVFRSQTEVRRKSETPIAADTLT